MSQFESRELVLPRGDLTVEGPLRLDLTEVYRIEARQPETKAVNHATANELAAEFSKASGILSKYISWLRYEISKAEEQLELAKATVILETVPTEAAKLSNGLKPSEAWREALTVKDKTYQLWSDNIAKLTAVKALLEGKMKQSDRSYYTCYKERDQKGRMPTQNLNGAVGMTFAEAQKNFMGARAPAEKREVDDDVLEALKGN